MVAVLVTFYNIRKGNEEIIREVLLGAPGVFSVNKAGRTVLQEKEAAFFCKLVDHTNLESFKFYIKSNFPIDTFVIQVGSRLK